MARSAAALCNHDHGAFGARAVGHVPTTLCQPTQAHVRERAEARSYIPL
jgi:hypothetical protein